MRRDLIRSVRALVVFTLLLGLGYPLLVTGIGHVTMPVRADGSRIERNGRVIGSRLIGQDFNDRLGYFQTRPSVTGNHPAATYFNNRGPNQAALAVQQRRFALDYARREGIVVADVPVDAATTSASGVDPHISTANARIQAVRVARARGLNGRRVQALIDEHTDGRGLGFAGEPGVNVLELNLALDREARR